MSTAWNAQVAAEAAQYVAIEGGRGSELLEKALASIAELERIIHFQRIEISHRSRVGETLQRQLELAGLAPSLLASPTRGEGEAK